MRDQFYLHRHKPCISSKLETCLCSKLVNIKLSGKNTSIWAELLGGWGKRLGNTEIRREFLTIGSVIEANGKSNTDVRLKIT